MSLCGHSCKLGSVRLMSNRYSAIGEKLVNIFFCKKRPKKEVPSFDGKLNYG